MNLFLHHHYYEKHLELQATDKNLQQSQRVVRGGGGGGASMGYPSGTAGVFMCVCVCVCVVCPSRSS